jgi:hypothetical protein
VYENFKHLKDTAALLDLAILKTKLDEHGNDKHLGNMDYAMRRAELRSTCGSTVIFPNVLSFLVGE